jgi:hypothetical protein
MVVVHQTIIHANNGKKLTSRTNSALGTTGLALCGEEEDSSKCFSSKTGELDVALVVLVNIVTTSYSLGLDDFTPINALARMSAVRSSQ